MVKKKKKVPVDNSRFHKSTGFKVKDGVYNWIVERYGVKGNKWNKSDTVVWSGVVYEVPTMVGYMIQVAIFWWIAKIAIKRNGGDSNYGIMILLILMLWRIGMLLKQAVSVRQELEYLNGRK